MDSVWVLGVSTVIATLLGPVFAVQAQKFLEGRRSVREGKMKIFTTLMATRGATLSFDHVTALNMIDLAFHGGSRFRKRSETDVLDAWRDYLDHLNTPSSENNFDRWNERQEERLIYLLGAMATDLGLRYDRVLLRNGAYIPRGHAEMEHEQRRLRQLALRVLAGDEPLKMAITEFPVNPEFASSQLTLNLEMAKVLSGNATLGIHIESEPKRGENQTDEQG